MTTPHNTTRTGCALPDQIQSLLREGPGSAQDRPFLLVDHSGVPGLAQQLDAAGLPWHSLFGHNGTPEETSVAPVLVALDSFNEKQELQPGLASLCENASHSNSVSLLFSPLDQGALATRLARRLDVVTSDGQELLFRFADTRILASALRIITPEQRGVFAGVASAWWYCNRDGVLVSAPAGFEAEDRWVQPLALSDAQYGAFLEAALPDEVASLMPPEVLAQWTAAPGQRHEFLGERITAARRWGVSASADFALYCGLGLQLGPQFDEEPAWQAALGEVRAGRQSLLEAMESLDG